MITTRLPDISELVQKFDPSSVTEASHAAEILLRAQHLAQNFAQAWRAKQAQQPDMPRRSMETTVSVGGDETLGDEPKRSKDIRRSFDGRKSLDTALHPFRHTKADNATPVTPRTSQMETKASSFRVIPYFLLISPLTSVVSTLLTLRLGNAPEVEKKLSEHPTLAIWGDLDQFSNVKQLQKWAEDLQQANSAFHFTEVKDADHFWRNPYAEDDLLQRLSEWLQHIKAA
jgi:pimeloyl-ACP methyl ester carboxylesterase